MAGGGHLSPDPRKSARGFQLGFGHQSDRPSEGLCQENSLFSKKPRFPRVRDPRLLRIMLRPTVLICGPSTHLAPPRSASAVWVPCPLRAPAPDRGRTQALSRTFSTLLLSRKCQPGATSAFQAAFCSAPPPDLTGSPRPAAPVEPPGPGDPPNTGAHRCRSPAGPFLSVATRPWLARLRTGSPVAFHSKQRKPYDTRRRRSPCG